MEAAGLDKHSIVVNRTASISGSYGVKLATQVLRLGKIKPASYLRPQTCLDSDPPNSHSPTKVLNHQKLARSRARNRQEVGQETSKSQGSQLP